MKFDEIVTPGNRAAGINRKFHMKNTLILSGLLALIFSASLLQGQEKKDENKEKLKTVQVYEIIVKEKLDRHGDRVPDKTIIWPEFFPLGIGSSIDTVLDRQAGVDVQRIQQVGTAIDDSSIRLRGFGSRRILLAMDGIPLNTSGVAGGYFIDWMQIPLNNIERIEIIKGVTDPHYGNVLGGVINLVKRVPPKDKMITEVQLSGAEHASKGANIFHAGSSGAFDYSISMGSWQSDGYLRNGEVNRKNADLLVGYNLADQTRLELKLNKSLMKKNFVVNNRLSNDPDSRDYDSPIDKEFPASDGEYMYGGMGAYPEAGSWWEKDKWRLDLRLEHQMQDDGNFKFNLWKNNGDREAFNTKKTAGRVFHKTFYDDRSWGLNGRYDRKYDSHNIIVGVDYALLKDEGDTNHSDDFRSAFRNGYYVASKNLGLYLLDEISFFDGALLVTPGIRFSFYDGISGPSGEKELIPDIEMSSWAPSLRVVWLPDEDNQLYISVARALRMPVSPEHYWHYDHDDAGVNTSGLPFEEEDGFMLQGGYKSSFGDNTWLEVSAYYYDIDNYIQFDLINFVAYNIDKARIRGLEAELSHKFNHCVSAFINVTLQTNETEGDLFSENFVKLAEGEKHDFIPSMPEYSLNTGIMFKPSSRINLSLFAKAVSSQDVIYCANRLWNPQMEIRELDGYLVFDVEAKFWLSEKTSLNAFVRNASDEHYQERFGYPAAQRTTGLSLTTVF